MEYRRLGRSGLKVSAIGLGTWLTFGSRLDDGTAGAILRRALDLGVNLVDTADVYDRGGAEAQLGRLLADVPRKDVVLASKVYFPTGEGPNDRGLGRKHVFETLHASLRRLRTDYLDLFQCHRYDAETPLEETVRAFDDLVRQGKVLYWGVSCWTAAQIDEAVETARAIGAQPPVSNQPPYSLLDREIEVEVLPACRRRGLGVLAFSPLAQGVLTGKYLGGARPGDSRLADEARNRFMVRHLEADTLAKVEAMGALAREAGVTPAQLALRWVLRREEVASALVGATKVSQVEENAADVRVDPCVLERLDATFR